MTKELIKKILSEELFGNSICESLEDRHIVNYLYETLLLERLLVGEPISIPELRKLLRKKIVNFEFIKLDGEVRPARGTTLMKYIPKSDRPKGIRPSSPKVATFFDLEKDAWRSVSKRSKEIVLKKDKETGKPIIVVSDKKKEDRIKIGSYYEFTTNKGKDTYVEILKDLGDNNWQVYAPELKRRFFIRDERLLGQEIPEDELDDYKEKVEEPKKELKKPETKQTIVLPLEVEDEEELDAKEKPSLIVPETPEEDDEDEGAEELEK